MSDESPTQQSPIADSKTWKPTNKWNAGTAAGAICIISAWAIHSFTNVHIPTEVGMAFCYLVTQGLAYVVPNAQ